MKFIAIAFFLLWESVAFGQGWLLKSAKPYKIYLEDSTFVTVEYDNLVRYNFNGDSLTSFNYAKNSSRENKKYNIKSIRMTDGGFLLFICYAGTSMVKLKSNFDLEWRKEISTSCILDESDVVRTTSGGVFLRIKNQLKYFNKNGDSVWTRRPQIWNIVENSEGNGYTALEWNKIMNITEGRDTVWQTTLSPLPNAFNKSLVKLTSGYLVVNDTSVRKFSSNGNIIKVLNKNYIRKDATEKWIKGPNDNFLCYYSNDIKSQWISSFDSLGNEKWKYNLTKPDESFAFMPVSIFYDSEFTILFGTTTDSSSSIIKFNNEGNIVWKFSFRHLKKNYPAVANLIGTKDGYIGALGSIDTDYYIFKISKEGMLLPVQQNEEPIKSRVSIAPNPFSSTTHISITGINSSKIKFKIFNYLGELLQTQSVDTHEFNFERKDLLTGVYLYQIISEEQILASGKLLVQ